MKPRMLSISEVSVQTQGDDTVRIHLHSAETSIKYEDRGGKDVGFFFFFKSFSRKQTEQELQQNKEIDKNRERQNPRGIEQSTTEGQAGDAQGFTK